MRWLAFLSIIAGTGSVAADTVVAARNLRPGAVLSAGDVLQVGGDTAGSFANAQNVIGMEAKVAIYAGRPILTNQLGAPATIERNQLVELIYETSGLSIRTEGRALGRGSEGQRIRIMNLSSKASLFGTVQPDGTVSVSP